MTQRYRTTEESRVRARRQVRLPEADPLVAELRTVYPRLLLHHRAAADTLLLET